MVDTLERYFDANKTKPSDGQMITWATELKVPFDDVHEWFYKKWKGNIKSTYENDSDKRKELFEDVISDLKYVSNLICPKSTTQLGPIVSYYMGLLFYETHVCSH